MSETQQGAPRGRHHGGAVSAELRAALRRVVDETASEADWQAIVAWIRAAPGKGRLDVVRATARAMTPMSCKNPGESRTATWLS
jgi:hypothetical protein